MDAGVPRGAGLQNLSGPRFSRMAIWGAVFIVISPLSMMILALWVLLWTSVGVWAQNGATTRRGNEASATQPAVSATLPAEALPGMLESYGAAAQKGVGGPAMVMPCTVCVIGPLGLVGTVLEWFAFIQILLSRGRLRGLWLALLAGLFYPCLLLLMLIVGIAAH